ncbi:peptidoglycan-binding domain-containing protein [Microbacterium sp. BG28]|uniref:peptidoglycan-binding domain-containing protein n=1 Tax=Microbacterium sp. BG28 TaxID=3097356 RepID=UPI002A59945A|nr:peptidoglycan-binding domain-containing protein [Microbacterium sp. BG28]MDY0827780.1 peptidoglycan-binding domain-containing protein [Microbacterium sp. BG28]
MSTRRPWARVLTVVLVVVVASAAAFAGGWALRELAAPVVVDAAAPVVYVPIAEGEVKSTVTLGATSAWTRSALAPNSAVGVLTSLPEEGQEVAEGSVLYTVDLRPIVLGVGSIPMFRDLVEGASGDDVEQLQAFLSRLGYFNATPDGEFGGLTTRAVSMWQHDLGVERTSTVRRGDILFTSDATLRVVRTADMSVGANLSGGEAVLERLSPQPEIYLTLTESQKSVVAAGMRVMIADAAGGQREGTVGEIRPDLTDPTRSRAILLSADGGPLCADFCGAPGTESSFLVQVYQAGPVSGLTVPSTVIRTSGTGETFVVGEAGQDLPVTVLLAASGTAVIEGDGLSVGMQIAVPDGR